MKKSKNNFVDQSYRLTDNRSGESCTIKTGKRGNLTIFDEKANEGQGARRAIRHCPNQSSIFVDEQDQFALVEPIVFKGGYIKVPANQPMTQAFLNAHPTNAANTEDNGWFEIVDDEIEAIESIEDEELRIDVKAEIRRVSKEEDGIHKLSAVAAVLMGSVADASRMQIGELKRVLYNEAEANIDRFVSEAGDVIIFDDEDIQRKYLILNGIREGIIKKSSNGKSILWARDNKHIATAPRSVDTIDYFADFLTSDDGILVAEEIVNRS
jgi:hypothetical protein